MRDSRKGAGSAPYALGRVFRFGVFDAIPNKGELRKNGVRIKLSGQPFQILMLLLERRGEVVTREQLRQELWPEDTFVEFDHCLNTAVNRIREALGDSAHNPRFVKTLPQIGYRFLAPVEELGPAAPTTDSGSEDIRESPVLETALRRGRRLAQVAGGVLAIVVLAVGAWLFLRPGSKPGGPLSTVQITTLSGVKITPSLSPDGREIAFAWGGRDGDNLDIYAKEIGSDDPHRLTTSPADDFAPAYSPDGRSIAFYRRSGDSASIYVVASSGGEPQWITGLNFGPPSPLADNSSWSPELLAWSPDQQVLAAVDRTSPDEPQSIFLRSIDTREWQRLTYPPAGSFGDGSPAFSPVGQTVAFVRQTNRSFGDIYITSLTGGPTTQLTSVKGRIRGLVWTPDGEEVIFSSDRSGDPSLWRVSTSGGPPERMTGIRDIAVYPTISRAGRRLAYTRPSGDYHIWRFPIQNPGGDRAGGKVLGLTGSAGNPQLSPDMTRIAFSSRHSGPMEVWVCDADGANPVRLTSFGTYAASPHWSPDARTIAFDSSHAGGWDVYVISAEGGEPHRVTSHSGQDVRPSWSADGKWIYFGSDRSGAAQIWKVPAAGGSATQVTFHGGYEAVESPDGRFVYYTRRGVPGLWRTPVEGGEETLILKELQWEYSRNWTVSDEGIYYLTCQGETLAEHRCVANFYDHQSKTTEEVGLLGEIRNSGISMSSDGNWLLHTQTDKSETDIVMVENFR